MFMLYLFFFSSIQIEAIDRLHASRVCVRGCFGDSYQANRTQHIDFYFVWYLPNENGAYYKWKSISK